MLSSFFFIEDNNFTLTVIEKTGLLQNNYEISRVTAATVLYSAWTAFLRFQITNADIFWFQRTAFSYRVSVCQEKGYERDFFEQIFAGFFSWMAILKWNCKFQIMHLICYVSTKTFFVT